jgi:2-phosphosulfolactate phosphatase
VIAQDGFAYQFDWGLDGLAALAPAAAVLVLVDVLRFTTAVSIAVERGVTVRPGPWEGSVRPWTLSPRWIREHPSGSRLELASANGAVWTAGAARTGARVVLAGCFRNASAVARAAERLAAGAPVAVIGAGEDGRPAVEDLLGAGAVLAALDPAGAISAPACSPDAAAARAAFVAARPRLGDVLAASDSARELAGRGLGDDVAEAAALDVTPAVPILRDGAFAAL